MELNYENLKNELYQLPYLKDIQLEYDLKEIDMKDAEYNYKKSKEYSLNTAFVKDYWFVDYIAGSWEKISIHFSEFGYNRFLEDVKEIFVRNEWETPVVQENNEEKILVLIGSLNVLYSQKEEQDCWLVDYARIKENYKEPENT